MQKTIKKTLYILMVCLLTACTASEPKQTTQPPQNKQWTNFKDLLQKNVLDTDNIIKSYVDKKCHAKINDYRMWRVFSYLLSDKKKYQYEQKVCDCATKEALKQVTPDDLLNIVKPKTRDKTLQTLTSNVTQACIKKLI